MLHRRAPCDDRGRLEVPAGGQQDGGTRDGRPRDDRGHCPVGGERAGRAEGHPAQQRRDAQSRRPAGGGHDHGLHGRQAEEPPRRGTARPQQRLLLAPPLSPRSCNRRRERARQQRAGDAEEEEERLRVQGVRAGRAQHGAQVVADDRGPGQPRLRVVRAAGRRHVRGCRVVRQRVAAPHVDLVVDEIGAAFGHRVEGGVPAALGQQHDVVRRCRRLRLRRCADVLEERVGVGQVHHAVHPDLHRRQSGASDGHRVARGRVEVRGGLLRQQHPVAAAGQHPDLAGEGRAVPVRKTQYHAGAGGLGGARGGGGQAAGAGVSDGQGRPGARDVPHRGQRRSGVGAAHRLHLPVHDNPAHGLGGHRRPRRTEETAERRQERHGHGHAGRDSEKSSAAPAQQTGQPYPDHLGSPSLSGRASGWTSRPSAMYQRMSRARATSGSWVVTRTCLLYRRSAAPSVPDGPWRGPAGRSARRPARGRAHVPALWPPRRAGPARPTGRLLYTQASQGRPRAGRDLVPRHAVDPQGERDVLGGGERGQ